MYYLKNNIILERDQSYFNIIILLCCDIITLMCDNY